MKRFILTTTATIGGLAALLSVKTQTHPVANSAALPSAALRTSTSAAPVSPGVAAPSTKQSSAAPTRPATAATSYLGSAITTRYGIVQVKVTVQGSTITDVAFSQLTAFDGHSQQINSFAGPQLLKETLDAQSAKVDTVSGASYTSEGYRQSLQSALDQAGSK